MKWRRSILLLKSQTLRSAHGDKTSKERKDMRRGFGRPLRRGFAPDIPPALRRANQLLSNGDYAGAAGAFETLARAAEGRGGPRAPFFHIQAGRAYILANQSALGVDQLQRGLGLFGTRGQLGKVYNIGNRVVNELKARNLAKEANKVAAYIKTLLPGFDPSTEVPAKRPPLPTHCPSCGAPVRSDEVDWMDDVTAECAFCGSPVRGEN
ncbi:MAG TPA: hypothetical protein VHM28_12735 [Anaerolineales bacterium]|nr:hypothetical protein [Anaerolineales bacterium]